MFCSTCGEISVGTFRFELHSHVKNGVSVFNLGAGTPGSEIHQTFTRIGVERFGKGGHVVLGLAQLTARRNRNGVRALTQEPGGAGGHTNGSIRELSGVERFEGIFHPLLKRVANRVDVKLVEGLGVEFVLNEVAELACVSEHRIETVGIDLATSNSESFVATT